MAIFIDLWPCLFTTKLSYAHLFKWGHSKQHGTGQKQLTAKFFKNSGRNSPHMNCGCWLQLYVSTYLYFSFTKYVSLFSGMVPDILRGLCPMPCDKCQKKQIQKVMSTISRKYPKKWSQMLSNHIGRKSRSPYYF